MRGVVWLGLGVLCGVPATGRGALQLTPGNLVVSTELSGVLREVDPFTGTTLSSVQLRTPSGANINSVFAITEVAGDLYVSTGDYAGRVNPSTGTVVPLYVTFSGGLGNREGLLLGQGSFTINTRTTEGVLVSSIDVDGQTAGIPPEVSDWFRDVDWTPSVGLYSMLVDTHSNPSYFWIPQFNDAGAYSSLEVNYLRPANYNANGFDIVGNQRWVALNRADDFNSQVRLYEAFNPTAVRVLSLPFGGASDIVYIVPTPASAAVLLGAGVFAVRRRR